MVAGLTDEVVCSLAQAVTGRADAAVARWSVEPSTHRVDNMTTERLDRLTGTLDDGTTWSVFAKTLQPASASPLWPLIPPEHHADVLADLDWLDEPRVYGCGLRDHLPPGLRLPLLHRVDRSIDRITLWLEDVGDGGRWDLDRYHRSAVALGRLSARLPEERASVALAMGRRSLDRLFHGKVTVVDLPAQADDGFWADPAVASAVDDRHRAHLGRLVRAMPRLLQRLARLPHGMAHGDAAPDNLREPGDGTVVALDWSYGSCAALGSDLGQLLAGRVESGAAGAAEVPAIAEAVFEGYLAGLAEEGTPVDPLAVAEGWATSLAVRSVCSTLVVDHRADLGGVDRCAVLAGRAALGRFGLDLVDRVLASSASAAFALPGRPRRPRPT